MTSFDFLSIHENKTPIRFMLTWHVARENYVIARVALQVGMIYPSCLLAEQSVEMYVKAILSLSGKAPTKQERKHYIPKLLELGKDTVPYFKKVLTDAKLMYFIENLNLAYKNMRFGEVGFSAKANELIQVLDEVAFNLDLSYRQIMKNTNPCPLYVPDELQVPFLQNNKFFSEENISSGVMARMPMP